MLRFGVAESGNVIGGRTTDGGNLALGSSSPVIACVALVLGARRGEDGGAVGVTLVVFGAAFAASAAVGRSHLGLGAALRYAPFVLMLWTGTYLLLISLLVRGGDDRPADGARRRHGRATPPGRWAAAVLVILLGTTVFQVAVSDQQGMADARGWHARELTIANVEANVGRAPDALDRQHVGVLLPLPASARSPSSHVRIGSASMARHWEPPSCAEDWINHSWSRWCARRPTNPSLGDYVVAAAVSVVRPRHVILRCLGERADGSRCRHRIPLGLRLPRRVGHPGGGQRHLWPALSGNRWGRSDL